MTTNKRDKYYIQSVDNALQLLETLCGTDREVHLGELSHRIGLSKSTIYRLLVTFQRRGYVEQDEPSHGYRLGLSAFEMGRKCLSRMALLSKAHPVMEQLTRQTREATYLAVRRSEEILLLDLADTPQQVKIVPLTGERLPVKGTAVGKLFAAFSRRPGSSRLPEDEREQIRRQGFTLQKDDIAPGAISVAAPLLDYQNRMPGALLTVVPDFRLQSHEQRRELVFQLQTAAEQLSSQLGHQNRQPLAQGA